MSDALKLLLLFAGLSAVIITVFVVVAWSTRLPSLEQSEVSHGGYVIRRRWFAVLLVALLASFVATVPFFPYLTAGEAMLPALRVPVVAVQFSFMMPDHLPVERRVLFEVTSNDVNHGFGIYDAQGHLVAQTQAMPDYVNYLAVTFHQPGQYKIRCLEYCGIGHHLMEKDVTVGDAP